MTNRSRWVVVRSPTTGFFAVWGQRDNPEEEEAVVLRNVEWDEACNTSRRLNAVRVHFGPAVNNVEVDKILVAYDILVERGDIQPVSMMPNMPEAETA